MNEYKQNSRKQRFCFQQLSCSGFQLIDDAKIADSIKKKNFRKNISSRWSSNN